MIKNCVSMYILTIQIEIKHLQLIRFVLGVIYDPQWDTLNFYASF